MSKDCDILLKRKRTARRYLIATGSGRYLGAQKHHFVE